ncbi:hypothetical protein AB0F13_18260 [Streptomyces sp. NPDC026206]|uniref:hypothetical protein n=1 Tax=Streptomyces sp. NPDC026206 TaxID=3157089 RepID=UPI003400B849
MRFPARRTAALLLLATVALGGAPTASAAPAGPVAPEAPHEAECHTRVHGSHATTHCFNGNAVLDRVQLHLECARWWDPAMDTAPVTVGPARHVTLAQRCWLGIRRAWVTHTPG